jgi:ferredoxin-fold anticodon binding domain-containing protein
MDLDKIRVMDEEEELGRWEAEEVEQVGIEVAVVLAGEEVVEEVVL